MPMNSTHHLNHSNNVQLHGRLRNFFEPDYDGCLIVLCIAVIWVNILVLVLYSKTRQLRTKTLCLLVWLHQIFSWVCVEYRFMLHVTPFVTKTSASHKRSYFDSLQSRQCSTSSPSQENDIFAYYIPCNTSP